MPLFLAPFLGVLLVANALLGASARPEYATWTGIRPLEAKLQLLEAFAAQGPVDALVLGSSIGDFGFSTETFARTMSAGLGREYRAFNFSTGAAEPVTFPKLYRLARTVSKPRAVLIIAPPEPKRRNVVPPRSPDYILERAPIGPALSSQALLNLDKAIWSLPLVRLAAPLRDELMYGEYVNQPLAGSDLYRMTASGDSIGLTYAVDHTDLTAIRETASMGKRPLTPAQEAQLSPDEQLQVFFNELDVAAIGELRQLTEQDGGEIVVIGHDQAANLLDGPNPQPLYRQWSEQQRARLAAALGARSVSVTDRFAVPWYGIMDSIHLNRDAAQAFTQLTAQALLGQDGSAILKQQFDDWDAPDRARIQPDDRSFNTLTAVVRRRDSDEGKTLRLSYMRSRAVPPLPAEDLWVALRLPNDTDLLAPAVRLPDGTLEATFADLPNRRRQVYLTRLVVRSGDTLRALGQSLTDYAWRRQPTRNRAG